MATIESHESWRDDVNLKWISLTKDSAISVSRSDEQLSSRYCKN